MSNLNGAVKNNCKKIPGRFVTPYLKITLVPSKKECFEVVTNENEHAPIRQQRYYIGVVTKEYEQNIIVRQLTKVCTRLA